MVDEIINNNQFERCQKDKEKKLLEEIKKQLKKNTENQNLNSMYKKLEINIDEISSLTKVPFIPVNMFKKFELRTCKEDDVVRILNSSSTTGSTPSKIYIDKETAIRQSKGLIVTLKSFLGSKRRPMLIIDSEAVNRKQDKLSARGAGIRGVSNFARSLTYIMEDAHGDLKLNLKKLKEFEEKYKDKEVLAYGFTYIIWSRLVKVLKDQNIRLKLPKLKLLHSGGWKKLTQIEVTKEEFKNTTAEVLGTVPENIIDFYGMVEQLGVVFVDCECGYKHVPDFAEVILRDFKTLKEVKEGQIGIIEVLSSLTSSYPGQAILTEDVGRLVGVDNCKCGRKGKYFEFVSRVEKSETRGCGDTFAEGRDRI